MALKIGGPNFGIDGGPGGPSQALLATASLLSGNQIPGLWLLLTGWNHEPISQESATPGSNGHAETGAVCQAVALALVPARPRRQGWRLHVLPGSVAGHDGSQNGRSGPRTVFSLEALMLALAAGRDASAAETWGLRCGGTVTLERGVDGEESNL
jgi:hypothetical protein